MDEKRARNDSDIAARIERAMTARVDIVAWDNDLVVEASRSSNPVIQAGALAHEAYGRLLDLDAAGALPLLSRAVELLDSAGSGDYLVLQWFTHHAFADCLDELGLFDFALAELQRAMDIAHSGGLIEKWERSCSNLVFVHRRRGDAVEAVRAVELLMNREQSAGLIDRLHMVIADLYLWLRRPEDAIQFRLAEAERRGWDVRSHREAAGSYLQIGNLEAAAHHRREAEAMAACTNIDENARLKFFEIEFALAEGKLEEAEGFARQAVATAGTGSSVVFEGEAHTALAGVLVLQERWPEALAALELIDPRRLGSLERMDWYRLRGEVCEAREEWREAVNYLTLMIELKRSSNLTAPAAALLLQTLSDLLPSTMAGSQSAARVVELRRAISARDKVLLLASKDLRGPLASMQLAAGLLAGGSERLDIVPLLDCSVAELTLTAHQLAEVAAWEEPASAMGLEPLLLGRLVSDAWSIVGPVAEAKPTSLQPGECDVDISSIRVQTNRASAVRCLASVFSVATILTATGRPIQLDCEWVGDSVLLAVHLESAIPLDRADLAALFAWQRPVHESGPGSAVGGATGLSVARTGFERLGGTLLVESGPDASEFRIVIQLPATDSVGC